MLAGDDAAINEDVFSDLTLCTKLETTPHDDVVASNGLAKHNHVVTSKDADETGVCESGACGASSISSGKDDEKDPTSNSADQSPELSLQSFEKLRADLEHAQKELRTRDGQCRALSRVRDEVDLEIEELTASLFEEAHKMVNEANVGQASAQKKYYECQLKLDGVQAEVAALKILVITSTPSRPNTPGTPKKSGSSGGPASSSNLSQMCSYCDTFYYSTEEYNEWSVIDKCNAKEVDAIVFQYFVSWIESQCPSKENDFYTLVLKDDIGPCLRFPNEELARAVIKAVHNDTLAIEPIQSKPKKCALTGFVGNCPYRIRLADCDQWLPISNSCRSRIVSVIDLLTFLRYIRQGILKKDINVLYWQMMKHRAEISLARLGLERKTTNRK